MTAVEVAAHEHGEPGTGPAAPLFGDLQDDPGQGHRIVARHDPRFFVTAGSSCLASPLASSLDEVLDRVTMQLFGRWNCTMIAAPVQRDVDGCNFRPVETARAPNKTH
jgi:hypothetical protein